MPLPSLAPISRADPLMLRLWQSGREIFHSNTLAFLIGEEQYGPCLLETLTGDSGWTDYDVRTLREKWQLDIFVIARKKPKHSPSPNQGPCAGNAEQVKKAFDEWRIVVIENKFKSLPDQGQLMRYTKKLDDQFKQTTPGDEGCNGQRSAGTKLLCELWRADSPEKTDDPAESVAVEEHTDQAKKSGNTLNNRQRVNGTLYRVILQPTLAKPPHTPCASKPCAGCAATIADCAKITSPNTASKANPPGTLVRHWRAVSYQDLVKCLPMHSTSGGSSPSLGSLFIPAYRDLVDRTCTFHEDLRVYLKGHNPFADVDQLEAGAQALGVWDFIDKWRYGWLTEEAKLKIHGLYRSPGQPLQLQQGRAILPDHLLFSGTNNLKCWIIASSGYSRGTGLTNLELIYYLDNPTTFTRGKYTIEFELQGGSLRLMLGHPQPIPSWVAVAPLRLDDLSKELSPCLPQGFSWRGNGSPTLGRFGGGQKVSQLTAWNQLTKVPGSNLYWSAQMWSGNPPAGNWARQDMGHIAGCIACSARSILQWLDANAIVSGVANPDWF